MAFQIGFDDGKRFRRPRGATGAAGAAPGGPARRESRASPAAGEPHRRERAAWREARRGEDAHRSAPEAASRDRVVSEKGALTISLLGREFRVACPEGEERQILAAADYLNKKLKEVRDTGKVVGNERIAIMAALNIAHESMSKNGAAGSGSVEASAIRRR